MSSSKRFIQSVAPIVPLRAVPSVFISTPDVTSALSGGVGNEFGPLFLRRHLFDGSLLKDLLKCIGARDQYIHSRQSCGSLFGIIDTKCVTHHLFGSAKYLFLEKVNSLGAMKNQEKFSPGCSFRSSTVHWIDDGMQYVITGSGTVSMIVSLGSF